MEPSSCRSWRRLSRRSHPGTTFDIAAEGSTTGIAAIIDGTAQIGMASRRAKPAEVGAASGKGINMKPTIVAYDGIAVIVNSANPIKGLTKKQVEQIFTGDVTDWSAIGGSPGQISVYTRNTSSGTYSDFKELAMKKRDYASSGQKMAGNEQIASEVGKNPQRRRLRGPGLHQSRRDQGHADRWRITLGQDVSRRRLIPYARPTFYYTNGDPSGVAKEFVDFTISPTGQKIVLQVGFVPIR